MRFAASDAPGNVSFQSLGNGIVNLKWCHPWRTGGPLTQFLIILEVISTNLAKSLSTTQNWSHIVTPMTKSDYEPNYSKRMDLLPSTLYRIMIQAQGNIYSGKIAELIVRTGSAFAFDVVQPPVIDAEESQIKIFMPLIVNDTRTNVVDVIVIGPPRCNDIVMISDVLANDLELDSYADAWCVATFRVS